MNEFDLQDHVKDDIKTVIKNKLHPQVSLSSLESFDVSEHVITRFEMKRKQNKNLQVQMVFHGTSSYNYNGIKSKGLVVPGTHGVRVVNGSSYGVGIYLSQCPRYSLSYVRDDSKLLVCAVLVGDPVKVTNHGNILVAKDESYVLPCFVAKYSGGHNYPRSSRRYYPPRDITLPFRVLMKFNFVLLALMMSIWLLSGIAFVFAPTPFNFVYYALNYVNWFLWVFFTLELSIVYNILWFLYYISYYGVYLGALLMYYTCLLVYYIVWAICYVVWCAMYYMFYALSNTVNGLFALVAFVSDFHVPEHVIPSYQASKQSLNFNWQSRFM